MVTNLFLAWIPLGLAYAIAWAARREVTRPALPLLACAWILFLPNAPYLVTDIVHLHRDEVNVVNAIELTLLAICGLLIAVKSVQLVQRAVETLWGVAAGWRAVQAIIVLAAARRLHRPGAALVQLDAPAASAPARAQPRASSRPAGPGAARRGRRRRVRGCVLPRVPRADR